MDAISAARSFGPPIPMGRASGVSAANFAEAGAEETSGTTEPGASFASALTNALGEVDGLQQNADTQIQKLATGEVQDIHQVMAAFEQARLSMQSLIEVRNKLVEAYQEVSRMPM